MNWLLLVLFGVAIGVLSGMLGIGGGVALVPGLILLFGFSQAEAQGTSLAVMIPPVGIFAAMVYYDHGFVRLPVVGFTPGWIHGGRLSWREAGSSFTVRASADGSWHPAGLSWNDIHFQSARHCSGSRITSWPGNAVRSRGCLVSSATAA